METKTVTYNFSYNNRQNYQHTDASYDMICPWCWLNCITVISLLWHLKLCHPRFNFQFTVSYPTALYNCYTYLVSPEKREDRVNFVVGGIHLQAL